MSLSIFFFFLFSLVTNISDLVENPCGTMRPREDDGDWGIGAFYIPNSFEINLYADTLGSKGLNIKTPRETIEFYDNSTRIWIESYDLEWVGNYNNELLKVKLSQSSNYYTVLWKHKKGGYFVSKDELYKNGAIFYTYKDLLFDTSIELNDRRFFEWSNIGVNLNKNCLRLRTSPDTDSEIITCVQGNDWENTKTTHMKILSSQGDWAHVEVTTLVFADDDGDCPSQVENKWKGWLKAIDDNGFPNIWYAVSSY